MNYEEFLFHPTGLTEYMYNFQNLYKLNDIPAYLQCNVHKS